jgi:hypothetical protein
MRVGPNYGSRVEQFGPFDDVALESNLLYLKGIISLHPRPFYVRLGMQNCILCL